MDTDNNLRSYHDLHDIRDEVYETLVPNSDTDDTLKISKCSAVTISNKTVHGGNEDCVDLVRVQESDFINLMLSPRNNGITIKGASVGNEFIDLQFATRAATQEIEIGQFDNYWYPGRRPSERNYFSGPGRLDGERVRVVVWDGKVLDAQFAFDSGVEIKRVSKFIWYPYFLFQYARIRAENLIRKLRNQPLIVTK